MEARVGVAKHKHARFFNLKMVYGGKSYPEHLLNVHTRLLVRLFFLSP